MGREGGGKRGAIEGRGKRVGGAWLGQGGWMGETLEGKMRGGGDEGVGRGDRGWGRTGQKGGAHEGKGQEKRLGGGDRAKKMIGECDRGGDVG